MSFTIENEKQNRFPFLIYRLFVKIKHLPLLFTLKPTFSGVYIHFDSFLRSTYKFGTVNTLAYRCFRICSSWTKLHTKLLFLKTNFLKNGYPENFINISKDLSITYT